MAWVGRRERRYTIGMTDGYISSDRVSGDPCDSDSSTIEHALARNFYRLSKRVSSPAQDPQVPDPVQVWVIGKENWISSVSANNELFRRIHEDENRNDYRMVVIGIGWPGNSPYLGDWGEWLRTAGMTHRKRHRSPKNFHGCGGHLLGMMLDAYHEDGESPSIVLDRFGVPFTFYGDEGNSCDV